MSCFFDARTEQRKQDMSQTFVLVRIWNESLSGSELCWCLKCFSSGVFDIDLWRLSWGKELEEQSKDPKNRKDGKKTEVRCEKTIFEAKEKILESQNRWNLQDYSIWSLGTLPYSLSWQATLLANGEPWRFQDWAFWDFWDSGCFDFTSTDFQLIRGVFQKIQQVLVLWAVQQKLKPQSNGAASKAALSWRQDGSPYPASDLTELISVLALTKCIRDGKWFWTDLFWKIQKKSKAFAFGWVRLVQNVPIPG